MLVNCIAVGLGGFAGSVLRYLVSRMEFQRSGNIPVNTMIVNIAGAIIIGLIIAYAKNYGMSEEKLLFLKVGLCGGLTTFSTFSVETLGFFESGNILAGTAYALASVALSLLGVIAGLKIGGMV